MPTVNPLPSQLTPVLQGVWDKLRTENRPLSVDDFTGFDPRIVQTVLEILYRQGYVYNVEGLWAPTRQAYDKRGQYIPQKERVDYPTVSLETFANKLLPVALDHFIYMHPEYKKTFNFFMQNPVYKKGFTEDIFKILTRKYTKFDPRKANIPAYKYPEVLNSIEQAIVEELGEINRYHSTLKSKIPSVATNKATVDFFNQLMAAQGSQIISDVLTEAGFRKPGYVISEEDIKNTIANGSTKELIKGKRIDKEVFKDYLYTAISKSSYAKEHNIMIAGMNKEDILGIFSMQLQANTKKAAEVINNFRSSGLLEKYPGVLSSKDLVEANFASADLSGLLIANSDFTKVDFSNVNFNKAKIKNCNLSNAKFIDASLVNINNFTDNVIEKADFQGASIPKGFPDESNTGVPINLNFHEIAHNQEGLETALDLKSHSVHSLPLEEEEIEDAKAVAKALHGVLQHRSVISSLKLSWEEPDVAELAKRLYESGKWLTHIPYNGKPMKIFRKYQPGELVASLINSETPHPGKYYYIGSYTTPGTGNYLLLNSMGEIRKSQNIRKVELLTPEQKATVFGKELLPPSLSSLSLTAASLTESQVQQLKQWVLDPNTYPDFLPKDDPMGWLVAKNKSGELAAAGLVKAEINKLFGRARNLSAPKEPVISPEEQKKQLQNQSIEQFINKYKDAEEFPVEDVLSLMSETQGELRNLISAYGPMLSQAEARAILYGLASSLNQYHVPKSVTPKKWIKAFPYSVSMNNLSDTGTAHGVAGRGKQFGILIRPNLAQMSPELANSTMIAIEEAGTHLRGALAFSRIMPYHYTSIGYRGTESPTVKNVWFISEMQSDAYQKGNDEIKSKEKARAFRNYFRHWPEVLLGAIITQAQKAGVDEIWMPQGKDVIAKTDSASLEEDSWDYAYDRPAKAYGGKLKSIGDNIVLDPGSGYKLTTNMAYIIDISGIKKKTSLKLSWEENLVVNNTKELIQYLAPYQIWEVSNPDTYGKYFHLAGVVHLFENPDIPSGYTAHGCYSRFLVIDPTSIEGAVELPFPSEYPLTLVSEDWRKIKKGSSLQSLAREIDDYRGNIVHHMNFIINENLPKFPVVSKYITVDMLAQFAYTTFFDEYGVPDELKNNPEFIKDVKKVFEDEFGAKIWEPPYIDWLYWLQKALNDVLFYVHNQRHNVQPDMTVSDQELARDWFNFWIQDQVPADMKQSSWFVVKFIPAIQQLVKGQGLGDILSKDYIPPQALEERTQQIIHPTDTGEGEKMLEGEGEQLLPEEEELKIQPEEEKDVRFLSPNERRKTIDRYLDELAEAKESKDIAKVEEIKKKLQELSASSSLKLSWEEGKVLVPSLLDKSQQSYFSFPLPTNISTEGAYIWLLKELYNNGPQRTIQLWEKYVKERKGEDPDKLREDFYRTNRYKGISVQYYQGLSARLNDMTHFKWIAKSRDPKFSYVLLPKGLEVLKRAGVV